MVNKWFLCVVCYIRDDVCVYSSVLKFKQLNVSTPVNLLHLCTHAVIKREQAEMSAIMGLWETI